MTTVPPEGDQDLLVFSNHFSTRITATPTAFGLVAGDATSFAALLSDYSTRLGVANDPTTRTRGTIAGKNTSKAALLAKARILCKVVSAFPPLTPAQRADLGLNPRDVSPTPIPPPATRPIVTVDPAGRIRLADEAAPTRRARPAGTVGAIVVTRILDAAAPAPLGLSDTHFAALVTRDRHTLAIPEASNGKLLYVFAQWVNARGQAGPLSAVAVTTIAA
jgi:hypothetical protein